MRRGRVFVALLLAVVGPTVAAPAPLPAKAAPGWQTVATPADRKRLARLWEAWTRALAEVDAAGQTAAVTALGAVAVADAATMNANAGDRLAAPAKGALPGPGVYSCRTISLGAQGGNRAAVVEVDAPQPCRIEARGGTLHFEQAAGTHRLGGKLFADGDRMVFLGAPALSGEMGIMPYGADPERDAVGALRALGPGHWRLELPWPAWQSNLDLVEITLP